jgi:hypothetical protein
LRSSSAISGRSSTSAPNPDDKVSQLIPVYRRGTAVPVQQLLRAEACEHLSSLVTAQRGRNSWSASTSATTPPAPTITTGPN